MSIFGKLIGLIVIAAAFLFGLASVVYMSLQGSEILVPEITGKPLNQGEDELAALGLKMKKRADRFSDLPPNSIVEQLPKPGEIVKEGQMILVVVSKGSSGEDTPDSLKNSSDDDTEKIEEMISEKPKKPKTASNSNSAKKKADTTRDVAGNTASDSKKTIETDTPKKEPAANRQEDRPARQPTASPAPRNPSSQPNRSGPSETRPAANPRGSSNRP